MFNKSLEMDTLGFLGNQHEKWMARAAGCQHAWSGVFGKNTDAAGWTMKNI